MINIQICPRFSDLITEEAFTVVAEKVLEKLTSQEEQDITIVIEDDQFIQNLNRDFLGIDAPTDVLSFTANEIDPETNRLYIGDIILSLPRALVQAAKAGHSLEAEITLLIIHGLLHLFGYDHDTPSSKSQMWSLQNELLIGSGFKINLLPEE